MRASPGNKQDLSVNRQEAVVRQWAADFHVMAVVIDKAVLREKYGEAAAHLCGEIFSSGIVFHLNQASLVFEIAQKAFLSQV